MARRSTASSIRRDLVHPKLPPTITLAVAAEVVDDTVILIAPEPMTYNPRMQRPTSALPGLTYTDANGVHHPQLVTLNGDNTIATVDFGLALLAPGTLRVAPTMQALRSFRGGNIIIGAHTFPPAIPTIALGFVGFANGDLTGQGRWAAYTAAASAKIDTEKATIDVLGIGSEWKNLCDISDLVTDPLTLQWTLQFAANATNKQHQMEIQDVSHGLIWAVQFLRFSGDDTTVITLFTDAGVADTTTITMATLTPFIVKLVCIRDHAQLLIDEVVVLEASLANSNPSAIANVFLDLYAANTLAAAALVSAVSIKAEAF